MSDEMKTGTVKFFNTTKGFGFIGGFSCVAPVIFTHPLFEFERKCFIKAANI